MIGDQITPGPHQLRLNFYDQDTGDRILSRVYTGSSNDGQFSATLQTDTTYRIDVTVCCNAPTVTITFSDLSFSEDTILDLTVQAVEVIFEVVDADGAAVPDAVIAVPSASGSNQRATWTARVFADPTDENGETSALLPVGTASDPSPRPSIAMPDGVKTTFSFPALVDADDPDPLGPTIPGTTQPETTQPETTQPETTEVDASPLPATSSTAVESESTTTADGAASPTTTSPTTASPTSAPAATDPVIITPLSSTSTTTSTALTPTTLTPTTLTPTTLIPTTVVPLQTTTTESVSQPASGTTTQATTTTTAGSTTGTTPTATTEAAGGATQQSTTQQSTTQQSTTVPDTQPSSAEGVVTTEIVSLVSDETAVEQASTTTTADSPVPATIEPTGPTFALTTMPANPSTSAGTSTTAPTGAALPTTTQTSAQGNPEPVTTTPVDPTAPDTTSTINPTSSTPAPATTEDVATTAPVTTSAPGTATTTPATTAPATTAPATTAPATTASNPAGPTITAPATSEQPTLTTVPSSTTTAVPTTGPPPLGPIVAEPSGNHVVRIVLLAPVGIDITGLAGLEVLGEIAPGSHSLRVSFYRQDIDELAARVTYTGDNNDGTYTVRLIAGVRYRAEVTICCEGPTVKLTFDDLSFTESTTADLMVRGAEVNIEIVDSEGDAIDSAVVEFTGLAGVAETIEVSAGPGIAWTADGSPNEDSNDGVFPTVLPIGSITSPLLAESDDDVPAAAAVSIDNGDPIAFEVPDIVFNANTVTVTVTEAADSTGSELSVTRPWIVPTIDQEKNDAGWISDPAQITWEVTDPTPSVGLVEIELPPTAVEAEGKKTYYSEEACDLEDNCSVGKLEVWLDSKAPTVGIYGFVDGKLRGAEPNVICTSNDTHSGLVEECVIETIAIRSEATDDQDGWVTTYEVTATASDYAGNVTEVVKTYMIETSDSVEVPVTTTIPASTTVPDSTTTSDPGADSTTTQPSTSEPTPSEPTPSEPTTTALSSTTTTGDATTTETTSPFDLSGSSPSSSTPQTTMPEPVTSDSMDTTESDVAEATTTTKATTSTAATASTPTTTSAPSSTTIPGSTSVEAGDSTTVRAPSGALVAHLQLVAAIQSASRSSLAHSGQRLMTVRH